MLTDAMKTTTVDEHVELVWSFMAITQPMEYKVHAYAHIWNCIVHWLTFT